MNEQCGAQLAADDDAFARASITEDIQERFTVEREQKLQTDLLDKLHRAVAGCYVDGAADRELFAILLNRAAFISVEGFQDRQVSLLV
jgi:hypothetical protein